jgi:hypothetical protein
MDILDTFVLTTNNDKNVWRHEASGSFSSKLAKKLAKIKEKGLHPHHLGYP